MPARKQHIDDGMRDVFSSTTDVILDGMEKGRRTRREGDNTLYVVCKHYIGTAIMTLPSNSTVV